MCDFQEDVKTDRKEEECIDNLDNQDSGSTVLGGGDDQQNISGC